MRVFGGPVLALLTMVALAGMPAVASADTTEVVGQQIKITAVVQPARYIIIDSAGTIQQIVSNTPSKDLEPTVYVGSITPTSQVPLTKSIADQEQQLLNNKTIKPGIIYRRPALIVTPVKNTVLTLLSPSQK